MFLEVLGWIVQKRVDGRLTGRTGEPRSCYSRPRLLIRS